MKLVKISLRHRKTYLVFLFFLKTIFSYRLNKCIVSASTLISVNINIKYNVWGLLFVRKTVYSSHYTTDKLHTCLELHEYLQTVI